MGAFLGGGMIFKKLTLVFVDAAVVAIRHLFDMRKKVQKSRLKSAIEPLKFPDEM